MEKCCKICGNTNYVSNTRNYPEKSEATYVNFKDGECVFYKEEEENDEEYNSRLKNEEEAKKLEFEKAKETYLRLKNNYETLKK
jgi:hypothetical protein